MLSLSFRLGSLVILTAMFSAVGCRPAEQIRTYTVPKETAAPRTAASKPLQLGEETDRMLVAVVPNGEQAWVYKVVGPIPTIDAQAEAVLNFVASVPPAGGAALPAWKLPEGWTQQPGDGIRLVTIRIPAELKPLELTLNTVPWRGTSDQVLQNVNRWRGQLSLPEATVESLQKDVRELKGASGTITVVDLRGRAGGSGMMPPFAGGGSPRGGAMPAGHPPIGANEGGPADRAGKQQPAEKAGAEDDPKFTKPDSWQPAPASQLRRFGFQIADGPQSATVTIFVFGANSAPMISDPLENVNRWRGEVGMPPVSRDELEKTTERIEIDGRPATYVALIPDVNQPSQVGLSKATLGVMATVGNQIWYFKMNGSRELVAARQDEFKAFLKTVRFAKQ